MDDVTRLVVNSSKRDVRKWPVSTKFAINMSRLRGQHIHTMRVIDVSIPNTFFNINDTCNRIYFSEFYGNASSSTNRPILFMAVIPTGNYQNMFDLCRILTNSINTAIPISHYASGFPHNLVTPVDTCPRNTYIVTYSEQTQQTVIASNRVCTFHIHCAPIQSAMSAEVTEFDRSLYQSIPNTLNIQPISTSFNSRDITIPSRKYTQCYSHSVTPIPLVQNQTPSTSSFVGFRIFFENGAHNIVYNSMFDIRITSKNNPSHLFVISRYFFDDPQYTAGIYPPSVSTNINKRTNTLLDQVSSKSEQFGTSAASDLIISCVCQNVFDTTVDQDLECVLFPYASDCNASTLLGFTVSSDAGYTSIPVSGINTKTNAHNEGTFQNISIIYPVLNETVLDQSTLLVLSDGSQISLNTTSTISNGSNSSPSSGTTDVTTFTVSVPTQAWVNQTQVMTCINSPAIYPKSGGYLVRPGLYVSNQTAQINYFRPIRVYMKIWINNIPFGNINILTNPSITRGDDSIVAIAEISLPESSNSTTTINNVCHKTNDMGWVIVKEYIKDMDRIFIELVDQDGNDLNIHGQNWTFTLEVRRSEVSFLD